jgi:hypothetical protein
MRECRDRKFSGDLLVVGSPTHELGLVALYAFYALR